jgi:hypothetical protein
MGHGWISPKLEVARVRWELAEIIENIVNLINYANE